MLQRVTQLREAGFTLWVWHVGIECPELHAELDGLVLEAGHEFWRHYSPPLGWDCGCYIVGTSSTRGAVRLHGDPEKQLPDWWDKSDPDTGLRPGISELWDGEGEPDVLLLLAGIVDGLPPVQPD